MTLQAARLGLVALFIAGAANAFSPGQAGFEVRVRGETISLEVMGVFVVPGETLEIALVSATEGEEFRLRAEAGEASREKPDRWLWRAPVGYGETPSVVSWR